MTAPTKPTKLEIEVVAKAMWDSEGKDAEHPDWDDLDMFLDAELKREFCVMAEVGINAFLKLRR